MNLNIDESMIPMIVEKFGLSSELEVKYDFSEHYKCYMDDGWEADC